MSNKIPIFVYVILSTIHSLSCSEGADIYQKYSAAVAYIESFDSSNHLICQGSGFCINASGSIVTNHHVVDNAQSIAVTMNGKRYVTTAILCADRKVDTAILQINGEGLPTVKCQLDDTVQVGEKCYVISNPMGMEKTFTEGVISAVRQSKNSDGAYLIQNTADISHGSSGGPLFNHMGKVIGITTMSLQGAQNINMAVPTKWALMMYQDKEKLNKTALVSAPLNTEEAEIKRRKQLVSQHLHNCKQFCIQKDKESALKEANLCVAVAEKLFKDSDAEIGEKIRMKLGEELHTLANTFEFYHNTETMKKNDNETKTIMYDVAIEQYKETRNRDVLKAAYLYIDSVTHMQISSENGAILKGDKLYLLGRARLKNAYHIIKAQANDEYKVEFETGLIWLMTYSRFSLDREGEDLQQYVNVDINK